MQSSANKQVLKKKYLDSVAVVLWLCGLAACAPEKKQQAQQQPVVAATTHSPAKPPATYTDTVVVTQAAAVFFSPDSAQLAQIKAQTEPMTYESDRHDFFYLHKYARQILAENYPQLKVIEVEHAQYLLFKNADTIVCIDLNKKNDTYGLFLYDGFQLPASVDMPNVSTALWQYFKK
jgi:hypothetical protein